MRKKSKNYYIHPVAEVSDSAAIGNNSKIWHHAQVRENVKIGEDCIVGKGVYVDKDTQIGNRVKIQNYASLYYKAVIEEGVFIGPHAILTNDKTPRAITPDGKIKSDTDWTSGKTTIKKGASIGTGTIILPNITIGKYAMIGAGSLVTKDVPEQGLVYGSPARLRGYVCKCGEILTKSIKKPKNLQCKNCRKKK